jgi:hypothetical protein
MKRYRKPSIFLALVIVMTFTLPVDSWAGGYVPGGYHGYSHGYRGYYSGNRYPRYYGGRGYYYRGYYPGYYPGYYGCGNCGNHHHHNNDDLWLGLLGGTLIGYTLNAIHQGY